MIRCSVVVLLVVVLTACGRQDPAPVPQPEVRAAASKGDFDATAQAFVELVIATDTQAAKLMDLGAARANDPALRRITGELAASRRTEATGLHRILDAARIPYVDNHAGHDMPGMPTEAELAALPTAADFDGELTRLVRAHLTESATVATSGATSITHQETKAVADAMVLDRATALKSLDGLG